MEMDEFLERLAITGILIMLVILIVFPVLLFVFFRGKNEKNIVLFAPDFFWKKVRRNLLTWDLVSKIST